MKIDALLQDSTAAPLIRANFAGNDFPKKAVPEWFTYMPGGVTFIHATYGDKEIKIAVRVHAGTVATINSFMAAVKARYPNLRFYADEQKHAEDKATMREPFVFEWDETFQRPNVQGRIKFNGVVTPLGKQEIEDEIYWSFSPSFDTDADYIHAVEANGILSFPAGTRGSKENPAEVTKIGLAIGTLTNDPAFKNMPLIGATNRGGTNLGTPAIPLTAPNADNPGGQPAAIQQGDRLMKLYFIKAHAAHAKGAEVEIPDADAAGLLGMGVAIHATSKQQFIDLETTANQAIADGENYRTQIKARNRAAVQAAYDAGVERGAFIPNATIKANGKDVLEVDDLLGRGEADPDFVIRMIQATAAKPGRENLTGRLTPATGSGAVVVPHGGQVSLEEGVKGYIRARAPKIKWTAEGMKEAHKAAHDSALIFASAVQPHLVRGGIQRDVLVRAAAAVDTSTNDATYGYLQGQLILQQDLGFLENELLPLKICAADLSNEPILFDNWATTRYFNVPGVQKWDGTQWVGASAPAVVNAQILMDQLDRIPINIPLTTLAQTNRRLQDEQKPVILYGLAESMNKFLINLAFNGKANSAGNVIAFTGPKQALPLNGFGLDNISDLRGVMDIQKIKPVGRYVVLYTDYNTKLTKDRDVLMIQALANAGKGTDNVGTFTTGELPEINTIKPYTTQLATDGTNFGFAGNKSALMFASRQPYNFGEVWKDVTIPGSVDLIVSPQGLAIQYIRFFDLDGENAKSKVLAMYGGGIGNPATGLLITGGKGGKSNQANN